MYKVFVVIVTYNGARWLKKCIGTLRHSTAPIIPVVVDNCSDDNTLALLKEDYPEAIVIANKTNLGFGKANNIGIEYAMAQGADYVFLLNQDACIYADTIETLVAVSRQNPDYFVLSPLHLEGSGQRLDHNFSRWLASGYAGYKGTDVAYYNKPEQDLVSVKFVNAALWLLPRHAIEKIGGFDPLFFHYGEDVDYTNRVNFHGYKVGICLKAAGIHDRPQPELTSAKKQNRQKEFKRETGYFITLKNINRNFFYCSLLFIKKLFKNLLQDVGKLDGRNFFIDLKSAFITLGFFPQIYRHRALSQTQKAFLNVPKSKSFAKSRAASALTMATCSFSRLLNDSDASDLFVSYSMIIF